MAVYKIPQDVEADDKFVGPLSFKQFIFIGIAAVAGYLSFVSLTKGFWPALVFTAPIITVSGLLGFPWGRDQPTEIWLAARIRFFIKPRMRIWNQSGIKDLVTINVPKKIDKTYTNGLTQNEVQSRLNGLATLIDSRGWAIKNATQDSAYINPLGATTSTDDRLLDVAAVMPHEVSEAAHATDILDESSSSTAMHFDQMIQQSEQKHRQKVMQNMQSVLNTTTSQQAPVQQQAADFWFLNGATGPAASPTAQPIQSTPPSLPQPAYTTFNQATTVAPQTPGSTAQQPQAPLLQDSAMTAQLTQADEEALLKKVHTNQQNPNQQYGHMRTVMPIGQQVDNAPQPQAVTAQQPVPASQPLNTMTTPVNPAIIELAGNDDLNIDTIARQAHQQADNNDNEVVISLR